VQCKTFELTMFECQSAVQHFICPKCIVFHKVPLKMFKKIPKFSCKLSKIEVRLFSQDERAPKLRRDLEWSIQQEHQPELRENNRTFDTSTEYICVPLEWKESTTNLYKIKLLHNKINTNCPLNVALAVLHYS